MEERILKKRRIKKIEVNRIEHTSLKKKYINMFKISYVGLKQIHLSDNELKALNHIYYLTKKKKFKNLNDAIKATSKKFVIEIDLLKSLWSIRMNHLRHSKQIIRELFNDTFEIKKD